MNGSPTTGSAQPRRQQGLAWISALTVGVGAAGLLGAVAIAVNLHDAGVVGSAAGTDAASRTAGAPTGTTDDSSTSGRYSDDSSEAEDQPQLQSQLQSQLQGGTAPLTTNRPPVATSGGS